MEGRREHHEDTGSWCRVEEEVAGPDQQTLPLDTSHSV